MHDRDGGLLRYLEELAMLLQIMPHKFGDTDDPMGTVQITCHQLQELLSLRLGERLGEEIQVMKGDDALCSP